MSNNFRFVDPDGDLYPEKYDKKIGDFLSVPDDLQLVEPDDSARTSLITVKLHMKGVQANDRTATLQIGSTGYFKRKAGQFIYGKQNLHNGALGIIPQELDGFLSSNDIPAFDIDENQISSYFLLQFLGRENFYRNLEKIAAGTGSKRISPKALFDVTIPLPSLAEQEKIAEFFSALDERIVLTANKVKLLKEQKAGYLQKVFNRELVFTDDTGDSYPEWEQKKLGELGLWGKSYSYSRAFQGEGELRHIHYGDIHSVYSGLALTSSLPPISIESANHELANDGDVIFADASEDSKDLGKALVLKNDMDEPFISGLHTHRFTSNSESLNPYFLLYFTQTTEYYDFMRKYGTGVSVLGISKTNLNLLPLPLPSLPEQVKIAEFFSALDEQIELTENKLTLLKEQKKGYLQGIFG